MKHLSQYDHTYYIYRDQQAQYSAQTTISHYKTIMKQGLDFLQMKNVDYIVCPPLIEIIFGDLYPILPLFHGLVVRSLLHSVIGKLGFIGSHVQCELINLYWGNMIESYELTDRQISNKNFNNGFPIWTSQDRILLHRMSANGSKHFVVNNTIKKLLQPLKDAAVDTAIGLDWGYYDASVAWRHHARHMRWYEDVVLSELKNHVAVNETGFDVELFIQGNDRSFMSHKQLVRFCTRGNKYVIQCHSIAQ